MNPTKPFPPFQRALALILQAHPTATLLEQETLQGVAYDCDEIFGRLRAEADDCARAFATYAGELAKGYVAAPPVTRSSVRDVVTLFERLASRRQALGDIAELTLGEVGRRALSREIDLRLAEQGTPAPKVAS